MLEEVLRHIRNYFPDLEHQVEGTFQIKDGAIDPSLDLKNGQYILIEGSVLNDCVTNDISKLEDETFTGRITPLKIPKSFLGLVEEIEAYQSKATASPYTSESFAGYSYTKATNAKGGIQSWMDAFSTRLNAWRKL